MSELREKDYADLKMTRLQQQAKLLAIAEKKVSKGRFFIVFSQNPNGFDRQQYCEPIFDESRPWERLVNIIVRL
jgi:hypothetical protein